MTLDKEKLVFFAGKKMTVGEFIELYGIEEETEQTIQIVIEKLVKKGKLRYLDQEDPGNKAMEAVQKELELEVQLAEIDEEREQLETYKAIKKRENALTYEEVEIDFPNKSHAEEIAEFCKSKLKLKTDLMFADGVYVLTVFGPSEADVSAIKRRKMVLDTGTVIFSTTDKVAESVVEGTKFAADKVVLPTAKASLKAALGLTKTAVKTTTAVGSSLIAGATKESRKMAQELKQDEDVLRAKKELVDAKDAITRFFKRNKKSSGFRFK